MSDIVTMGSASRRKFLKSGAALIVGFSLGGNAFAYSRTEKPGAVAPGKTLDPNTVDAFLSIHPDGTITVFTGKVDLGTGNMTALAQVVAEEMYVPMEAVTMVQGDTALTVDQGATNSSMSIQGAGVQLRQAAATAREALRRLAMRKFGTEGAQIAFADGKATVAGTPHRSLTYAALLRDARLELTLDPHAPLKDPRDYRLVGKPLKREDIPLKVTGEFVYMHDVRVPDMVHARVLRPDAYGAQLVSIDDTAARAVPGFLQTVHKGNFVAVLARTEWAAIKAARTLKVTWSVWSGLPEQSRIYEAVRELKLADRATVAKSGDVEHAFAAGGKVFKATYQWPLQTHGSIGPSCAIARFTDGKLTLWSPTQAPHMTRDQIAAMLGIAKDDVRLIYVEGAGCYGRNGHEDATADAAVIAHETGHTVRVQWMRQDEHGWDPKGPPVVSDVSAVLGHDGTIAAWRYETWVPSRISPSADVPLLAGELTRQSTMVGEPNNAGGMEFNTTPSYVFPNVEIVVNRTATTPLRPAWLRGPGRLQHTTANESFMDELSVAARMDPVEFRLKHLRDERGIEVLKAAAKHAGWKPGPLHAHAHAAGKSGPVVTGRGVSYVYYQPNHTYVAAVAEVEVNRETGVVHVRRFTIAHDCGLVVNSDGVRNQIEGQVVQTISRTLHEEVSFSRAAVTSVDWASYRLLYFPEIPQSIDVVLIDRPDHPPLGAGEPSCAVVPSAIASGIYDALGIRLRTVPYTPDKVKAALQQA
jgi:nicotinate dehydrogenase subunit B